MQGLECLVTFLGLSFSPHVERNTRPDPLLRAYSVDTLLHLTIPPVAPLHCIGGRREQCVIEKRQRFLQRGRKELLERLTELLEPLQATPQLGQLVEGCLGPTSSVEQGGALLHELARLPQLWQTTGDMPQGLSLAWTQAMLA